jgi:hypothetical protein
MPINPIPPSHPHDHVWATCDHTNVHGVRDCQCVPASVVILADHVSTQWLGSSACDEHISSTLMEAYSMLSQLMSPGWTLIEYPVDPSTHKLVVRP